MACVNFQAHYLDLDNHLIVNLGPDLHTTKKSADLLKLDNVLYN